MSISGVAVLVAFQPCAFFKSSSFCFVGKVRLSLGSVFSAHWGKLACFCRWLLGFGCTAEPNKPVKGTRRPLAVLKFRFYQGSAASFRFR